MLYFWGSIRRFLFCMGIKSKERTLAMEQYTVEYMLSDGIKNEATFQSEVIKPGDDAIIKGVVSQVIAKHQSFPSYQPLITVVSCVCNQYYVYVFYGNAVSFDGSYDVVFTGMIRRDNV
jgi:hypothetical protein